MQFGPVPLSEALGAILAHSVKTASGKIPKGRVLTEAHINDLAQAGLQTVTVARLDPTDIHEDLAAQRLAEALVPDPERQGITLTQPTTGRVNLHAAGAGVAEIDVDAINALNRIHPMITLATVAPMHRTDARSLVGTVKIISYGVPETALKEACAAGRAAVRLRQPVYRTATLIETQIGGEEPADKGRHSTVGRLDRMGVTLTPRVIVPHESGPIAQAIAEAPGEVVLILTGSATSDPFDVAPEGVRAAGGEVIRFGMPVDPGNLLFVGRHGSRPVIGLPGCARAPALNGADWVLERVLCGIDVADLDIGAMGVGGLLKEIPTRPRPREG